MDARAPLPDRCLIIGAPHTSNWDGFFMLMAMWKLERRFHFLIKDSTMKVPLLGAFPKACGGISVNRADPGDLVARIIDMAETSDSFTLVIAPKGTRSPRPLWKSGFYRIATQANLPVVPGFIDSVTRSYGGGKRWSSAVTCGGTWIVSASFMLRCSATIRRKPLSRVCVQKKMSRPFLPTNEA